MVAMPAMRDRVFFAGRGKERVVLPLTIKLRMDISSTSSASTSVGGNCPFNNHAFAIAGHWPDGKVPEGWPCMCGLTVARWRTCRECGTEYFKAETKERDDPALHSAAVLRGEKPRSGE